MLARSRNDFAFECEAVTVVPSSLQTPPRTISSLLFAINVERYVKTAVPVDMYMCIL